MERQLGERRFSPAADESQFNSKNEETPRSEASPSYPLSNPYGGFEGPAVDATPLFDSSHSPYEDMWHSVVDEY